LEVNFEQRLPAKRQFYLTTDFTAATIGTALKALMVQCFYERNKRPVSAELGGEPYLIA